jgi:hypothetical protein
MSTTLRVWKAAQAHIVAPRVIVLNTQSLQLFGIQGNSNIVFAIQPNLTFLFRIFIMM